jgi:hypothetical protein
MRRIGVLTICGLMAACTSDPVTVPSNAVLYEVPRTTAQPMAPAAQPVPQVSQRDDFTSRIERALAEEAPARSEPGTLGLPVPVVVAPGAAAAPMSPQATVPGQAPVGAPASPLPAAPVVATQQAPGGGVAVARNPSGSPLDDDRLNLNEYTLEQQRVDAAIAERQLEEARRQLVVVQPQATVPQATQGVNIALYAKQTTHRVGERRYSRPALAFGSRGNCRRFATPDDAQRFFLASGGPERDPHNLDPEGDGFACGWDPEPFRRLGG